MTIMRIRIKIRGVVYSCISLFVLFLSSVFWSTNLQAKLAGNKHSAFNHMSESEGANFLLRCMKIFKNRYVEDLDYDTLIQGAIQGMCHAVDPHSIFFNEKEFESLQEQCKGSFGGIGIVMNADKLGRMRIISCLDDTPAAKAGILPGDIIVAIDDVVLGSTDVFASVSERMRGKPNTTVKLSIERKGQSKVLHFKVMRTTIVSGLSVKYHIVDGVATIRMASFDEQTPELLKNAILDIQKKLKTNLQGYIIDLRRNSGGVFDSAVKCCQLFIDKGILVRSKGRPGDEEEVVYAAPGLAIINKKPVVILIDAGTASAAEIMAGALQDYKKAVVMGVPSYGKGSTQEVIPLDHKAGAIKLTITRWYTPLTQRPIQGQGIIPDIIVEQVEVVKPRNSNSFVVRERNVSGTLRPESLLNDMDQKSGKMEKFTEDKATEDKATAPVSSDKRTNLETNMHSLSEKSTPSIPETSYDHQMTRAIDLIKAVHLMSKSSL